MKNLICKTALGAAVLAIAGACNAKRTVSQSRLHETSQTATVSRAGIKSAARTESASTLRLRIYETVAEKDTCGRTLKETRRTYDFSGHSAAYASDTLTAEAADSTAAASDVAAAVSEEKTSKPAAIPLALTLSGIAAGAAAAVYAIKKLMKFL